MKKIVYVDMDNVLVDFVSGINQLPKETQIKYEGDLDEAPGIFSLMTPMEGAIESFKKLSSTYDTYILSTAPWENASAWSDKLDWVKQYLGEEAHKRLILSHNKNLNRGDYLIDDRTANGADKFQGELIQFGSEKFPNWKSVCDYLLPESSMIFKDWDGRPAISFSPTNAVAILEPGGNWVAVDGLDVSNTGRVISTEADFRARFEGHFGKFALPKNLNK